MAITNLEVLSSAAETMNEARKALLGIPLLLFPGVTVLLALPLIWGVWSGVVTGDVPLGAIHPGLLAFSLLVAAALSAAPGYFVAAFEEEKCLSMKRSGRWWIRSSLAVGAIASVVATPLTFFFGRWLWVFPAGTLVACLVLFRRCERLWRLQSGGPENQ